MYFEKVNKNSLNNKTSCVMDMIWLLAMIANEMQFLLRCQTIILYVFFIQGRHTDLIVSIEVNERGTK